MNEINLKKSKLFFLDIFKVNVTGCVCIIILKIVEDMLGRQTSKLVCSVFYMWI